ncbi:MAG: TRAP transporter small permease [Balneolaceae bacterium]|nr:MAG: TRAP transporter small permease [Balneolaceae bacterium]
MDKIVEKIDEMLAWILIILMGFLVIDVTWQVLTRFLLGSASSFTEEVARFLLIWIGLLGAAYAYRKDLHLAFDYFSMKVRGPRRKLLGIFIHTLVALFSLLVLVIGGGYLVNLTWELNQVSAALQIRLAYVYSVLPLSGILIMLYSAMFIRDIYRGDGDSAVPEPKAREAV